MAITMTTYAAEREAMVERQLRRRGIEERPILDAFLAVPREAFVSENQAHFAYGDHPLPIEAGQTISQPYIVALMIQAADIKPGDTVLEVGAGSGYAAAVISRIAAKVIRTRLMTIPMNRPVPGAREPEPVPSVGRNGVVRPFSRSWAGNDFSTRRVV